MKKNAKFLIRLAMTILAFLFILTAYFYIIKPKYIYGEGFPTTSTYKGFYEIKKDSLDVIFLGSSHGVCAFDPEVMDQHCIRSYNLSCEQQNLFTSYYWLKEALKYQKPKTVVLDLYMLYLYDDDFMVASSANCTRKAFDFMRLSPNKISACMNASKVDEELTFSSMMLPNIMYHTRWKEIGSKDFKSKFSDDTGFLRGFYPMYGDGVEGFEPIDVDYDGEIEDPNPLMLEYLLRIMKLCGDKGINLILVSTPTSFETNGQHLFMWSISAFLSKNINIDFYDFNTKEVYEGCKYDFFEDNNDDDHANFKGAKKITNYLAERISND